MSTGTEHKAEAIQQSQQSRPLLWEMAVPYLEAMTAAVLDAMHSCTVSAGSEQKAEAIQQSRQSRPFKTVAIMPSCSSHLTFP